MKDDEIDDWAARSVRSVLARCIAAYLAVVEEREEVEEVDERQLGLFD